MHSLCRSKSVPHTRHLRSESSEFFEVEGGQLLQALGTFRGQSEVHHPVISAVTCANDETGRFCPVDEPDRAVVLKEEVIGDLADGRTVVTTVTSNREKQLVLSGGQVGGTGLLFAPSLEVTKTRAQSQKSRVCGIGEIHS